MKEDSSPDRTAELSTENTPDRQREDLAQALDDLVRRSPFCAPAHGLGASHGAAQPNDLGACPDQGEWLRLVSGEVHPPDEEALMVHAAVCGRCAQRLRQSLRLLDAEPSPEESTEIAGLASGSSDWQRRLAVRLARSSRRQEPNGRARAYVWAGAGLAAALGLAAGLGLWWQHVHTPERLLAEAYTHARIFQLRIPEAGFAQVTPQTHLRGGATGREAHQLLDARARIERRLESAPDDPRWLQLQARAYLLEERFDPAIDILDRLLAAGPVTASLLADDAAAYFQRGIATGSENDRATALDYLSRADELNPGDPVVLFNEAVVMEDRGQMMNAVETWNRYLRFEHDPRWLAEGRLRLEALERKVNELKSHQSRMDRYLATPQAMRALAADPAALGTIDEELSSSLLPKLLIPAFPATADRSRGSPCEERCLAARELLRALAASLERNHRDSWLSQLLPSPSTPANSQLTHAIRMLGRAIAAGVDGDFVHGRQMASDCRRLFHRLGNAAGEERAAVEEAYALQVLSNIPGCYEAAHSVLGRDPQFAWIQIHGMTEDGACDPAPGTGAENNPAFLRVVSMAQDRHYTLLELRARNWLGAAAVDTGDVETSWHVYLGTVRKFWSGDYPAMRLYSTISGLEEIEESTPRVHHALLLQREAVAALELSRNRQLIPAERLHLAAVAIRAGAASEAQEQMRVAQQELSANGGGDSVRGFLVENEDAMASLYLDRGDLAGAARMLDAAKRDMAGENNSYHRREYALAHGRLELALGHPDTAESLLRDALVEEERLAAKGGAESIAMAQQDRGMYAALAGIWLAQGRSGEDVLALWERYRLRILGKRVAPCAAKGLACLEPALDTGLKRLGQGQVAGQIVLFDRVLLYQANAKGVLWSANRGSENELLAETARLQRAASSAASSMESVDRTARRVGRLLLGKLPEPSQLGGKLLVESDPLLGNLPWPAVAAGGGPIGLLYDLEEMPSLLLVPPPATGLKPAGESLVVGASVASGEQTLLPEVLDEARAVTRFERDPRLLLASRATEAEVVASMESATAIHFAGHATHEAAGTRLLLAPSGAGKAWLDSELLRRHPPGKARLAVFSACATGQRRESWNHGMGDIVDTLAALGVPQVVATRWQIDSAAAVPMMDVFYRGLANGLTVPRALTAARLSLVKDARYRHPYYWAAYYASGSGDANLSGVFRAAR